MHLTSAGEILVRHIRSTMTDWQSTVDHIAELKGELRGELNLLAIPSFLTNIVPKAIEATNKKYRQIRFNIQHDNPTEIVGAMRAGRPDIALLFVDRRYRSYDICEQIDTRLGVIMRNDHPLSTEKELSLSSCAAYPIISLSHPWALNSATELEFARSGAQLTSIVVSNSFDIMKQGVKAGVGICISTPIGFLDELAAGELTYVPIWSKDLVGPTGLFVHKQRGYSPHVRIVVENLQAEISTLRTAIAGYGRP